MQIMLNFGPLVNHKYTDRNIEKMKSQIRLQKLLQNIVWYWKCFPVIQA